MKAKMIFGVVHVEAEGDAKEVFKELSSAAEVFGQDTCGACGSKNVTPVCREVEGNTYYEMRCNACGCALGYGQRKADGVLFPRRRKDDQWLPHKGWLDKRQYSAEPQAEPAMRDPF